MFNEVTEYLTLNVLSQYPTAARLRITEASLNGIFTTGLYPEVEAEANVGLGKWISEELHCSSVFHCKVGIGDFPKGLCPKTAE